MSLIMCKSFVKKVDRLRVMVSLSGMNYLYDFLMYINILDEHFLKFYKI